MTGISASERVAWAGWRRRPLEWVAATGFMLVALLTPAFYNRFPLVFADTGGYLLRPFDRTLEMGRSVFYGLFLVPGILFDFWPQAIAQSAVAVWVVALTLRALGWVRPFWTAGLVGLLCILSGLPWYASQLMPDIFVPLAVLTFYLLTFKRAFLSRGERIGLVVVLGASVASHMSILALSLAIGSVVATVRRWPGRRVAWKDLSLPFLGLGAGLALSVLTNGFVAGQFTFTPGGTSFIFGRLVQDGIVARYLADKCPDPTVRLCAFREEMPTSADDWLWVSESPLHQLGGWQAFEPEARRIVVETLAMYPGQHLATAIWATLEQLVMVASGEGMHAHNNHHVVYALQRVAPRAYPHYQASAQHANALEPAFWWINVVHVPVGLASTAVLMFVVLFGAELRVAADVRALAATVFAALVLNAAICGILSNPNDRYQSRLVWLAPLCLVIAATRRERDARGTASVKRSDPAAFVEMR